MRQAPGDRDAGLSTRGDFELALLRERLLRERSDRRLMLVERVWLLAVLTSGAVLAGTGDLPGAAAITGVASALAAALSVVRRRPGGRPPADSS